MWSSAVTRDGWRVHPVAAPPSLGVWNHDAACRDFPTPILLIYTKRLSARPPFGQAFQGVAKESSTVSRTRYMDLDDRTEDARELMRQRPREAREFLEKYELSWVYHENALEGMVLTHAELRQAFDPSGIVDSSMVHTYTEIRNQRAAIEFVKHEAKVRQTRYTLTLVKKLYEILYQGLPNRLPVALRRDMPLHRTYFHDIVQPVQIQPGLEQLFDFMNSEEFRKLHPIRQATHSHHRFMEIFPFSDLSGKVGRMMMNLILLRSGYMPVIMHSIDRQKYYEGLRLPATQFGNVVMDAMDNSLDNAFKFFIPGWNEMSRKRAASE
jgi:Fic family protein